MTKEEFLDELRELFPESELTIMDTYIALCLTYKTLTSDDCIIRVNLLGLVAMRLLEEEKLIQEFSTVNRYIDSSMIVKFTLRDTEASRT